MNSLFSLKTIKTLNRAQFIYGWIPFFYVLGAGVADIHFPTAEEMSAIREVSGGSGSESVGGGIGFAALDPYLATWRIFRNIGLLFALIILGIEVVALIKNSKERGATAKQLFRTTWQGLGMVFSYAFAGLIIDLIYLGYFASYYYSQLPPSQADWREGGILTYSIVYTLKAISPWF